MRLLPDRGVSSSGRSGIGCDRVPFVPRALNSSARGSTSRSSRHCRTVDASQEGDPPDSPRSTESEHFRDDHLRRPGRLDRARRRPREPGHRPSRSPSSPSRSPTASPATTCSARRRPARARPSPSASRCSTASRRPSRTAPTGSCSCPTRELANQVRGVLAPLGRIKGLRVKAFYGGVGMEPQIEALNKGVDVVIGTPGRLIDLMERRELSVADVRRCSCSTRPTAWRTWASCPRCRRSSTGSRASTRRCCSRRRSTAASTGWSRAYMHDPVSHEVESEDETVDEMRHHFLLIHQMDKVKVVAVDRERRRPHARLLPHQARRRPSRRAARRASG